MLLRSDQQAHGTGFKGKEEEKSIGITLISTKSNGRRVNEKWGRIEVFERTEKWAR